MPPETPLYRLLTPLLQRPSLLPLHKRFAATKPQPSQTQSRSIIIILSSRTKPTTTTTRIAKNAFTTANQISPRRPFSQTTALLAREGQSGKGFPSAMRQQSKRNKPDRRVTLIRYHLYHPLTPRPLRFSRMRSLRHWTIHRAWMLFRRKEAERRERELERQYQSMRAACEELRLLEGPTSVEDEGSRLYRLAMFKRGIWHNGGVPIEYARAQVERPGKNPWNHEWKR